MTQQTCRSLCCKTCQQQLHRLRSVVMATKALLRVTILASLCCLHTLHAAPSRHSRQVTPTVIFERGTCRDCHKLLLWDVIARCPPWHSDRQVSTILSYDSVHCQREEQIACVKVTDCSRTGNGAKVVIKSGNIAEPYIRLNITSHPGKGYRLCVEIRGINPARPDCK